MMNFEEFKAWVKENITSKDWKETSQVEISVVKKNNGVSKAGLLSEKVDKMSVRYFIWMIITYTIKTVSCWKMS